MTEIITSLQNKLVKYTIRLQQKAAERKSSGFFILEGRREVSMALSASTAIKHLFVCPDIFQEDALYPIHIDSLDPKTLLFVSREVYNKMAYRENKEGVIMVGEQHTHELGALNLGNNPLIIILEGVEKPGNLGAVMRTADAAGADAVILADSATDLYNPNTIRASLGCIFTIPTAVCSSQQAIDWLNAHPLWKVSDSLILAASLQTDASFYAAKMTGATALVFGAEDKGLSEKWSDTTFTPVRIPMLGRIDSLNLSASVAIMAFEAIRQRKFGF